MPQGRRKVPFSGKAKKEQLKAKKTKNTSGSTKKSILVHNSDDESTSSAVQKLNYQPTKLGKDTRNRYVLQFYRETDEEIRERKELAHQTLITVPETELEIDGDNYFPKELDFPKRPAWSFDMDRDILEARESKYFREYLNSLETQFGWKNLGFFELNLETWRQLWRVLEMSDIVLFILDIRFPALMFPPSMYEYVIKDLKKDMILVLNKIDLAPPSLVVAWKHYFAEKYPDLRIVMFTTLPGYNLIGKQSDKAGLQVRRKRGKIRMAAEGTQILFDCCKSIVKDDIDLASWEKKIQEELSKEYEDDDKVEIGETVEVKKADTDFYEHVRYKNGMLTIGCVGQPNAGKSSLMNAIMGKKVVSVSKTPGHTKHFQTIFLTPNVRLCDCPGLVFPSKVPKTLQVLMGSFPIAQLREPFTAIRYLAERLDLPKLLRIEHPESDDTWSAMDVCEGWAKKRGFLTARAARLDAYRAANNLLRMALDGKICLCLRPPGFSVHKVKWETHKEVETVKWIQARSNLENSNPYEGDITDLSEDEAPSTHHDTSESQDDSDNTDSSEDNPPVNTNKFATLNVE